MGCKLSGVLFFAFLATAVSLGSTLTSTTTTISSSVNPSTFGQTVTFTAKVTSSAGSPPNGETVNFEQGHNVIGTGTLMSGVATFAISTLTTGGTDDIKAEYVGDSMFASSTSSAVPQVVDPASTTTTLTALQNPINSGQTATFTATVAPQFGGTTVTGSVVFYNGSSKLGTVALSNESASYSIATLPAGASNVITATYKGSNSFKTSNSNAISETVDSGTTLNQTMTWDGVTRYYELFVPGVLPANPPMLLMLHGTHYVTPPANPSTMNWSWQADANLYGFILVQPASTYNPNTGAWNWNDYFMDAAFAAGEGGTCTSPPATSCPDDAGFLRQLITNLTAQYKVNPNEVYLTGFSSGAQMAERVGVELSDVVAAIAPSSGQLVGQQVPPPGLPGAIKAPVAVQEWHGTADTELPPCNYGTTVYSGVTFTLDTVDDTFNYWVQQNDCSVLQNSMTLCSNGEANPNTTGNLATSCAASNVEVQFIWEQGAGHQWLPKNNASKWLFLSAHPKPSAPKAEK